MGRTPAEDLARAIGTCDEHRRIARPARTGGRRDRVPDDGLRRGEDLSHREAVAVAQVADQGVIRPRVPGRRRFDGPEVGVAPADAGLQAVRLVSNASASSFVISS